MHTKITLLENIKTPVTDQLPIIIIKYLSPLTLEGKRFVLAYSVVPVQEGEETCFGPLKRKDTGV